MADKVLEFVQLIESFPCLYNHSLKEYSRKDLTEKAWAEIASEMDLTVSECKEKWRNVRNGFVKSLKALNSDSAAKSRKQYYLHDEMQFVIPFLKPSNNEKEPRNILTCHSSTANNLREKDTESASIKKVKSLRIKKKTKRFNNSVKSAYMQYTTAKRQNTEISMPKADTENPRKMFLLSLLPDIENLSDNNMRLLKMEIMSVIQKYQIAQQNQQSLATETYSIQVQDESNSQIYQQPFQQPYSTDSIDQCEQLVKSPID